LEKGGEKSFLIGKVKDILINNTCITRGGNMFKSFGVITLVFAILALVLLSGTFSDGYAEMISGRLVSTLDSESGKATVLFAGYCKDEPVIIGPSTKRIPAQNFTTCTKENIGEILLGRDAVVKQVTKFKNNGKEIMADIVIEK
jgi:hypothetical protein